MPIYTAYNAPMATTAATAKVTTGTSIKTMLQIATPATRRMRPLAWGFSLDAAPATTSVGIVELIQTDVAATVTAHVAAGVQPLEAGETASLMTLGTSATGYTGSAEGSTTATRLFDTVQVPGISNGTGLTDYRYQFLPEEWEWVPVSKFLRVRVTFGAAVNMLTWVKWLE